MSRAATWRTSSPSVRYDYAPRSWDTSGRRFQLAEVGRRENLWPLLRRGVKLAAVAAISLGIVYAGMNYRVRYLGDGTIRLEHRALWANAAVAVLPATAALATAGSVRVTQPARTLKPSPVAPSPDKGPIGADASPHARKSEPDSQKSETGGRRAADDERCKKNRGSVSAAIATYNRKFPGTKIRNLQAIALLENQLSPEQSICPRQGHFTLAFRGDEPQMKCSAHR